MRARSWAYKQRSERRIRFRKFSVVTRDDVYVFGFAETVARELGMGY
jgi:hypothetical protein